MSSGDAFALAADAAAAIAERSGVERHDIAVVLGSGWTPAAAHLGEQRAEIPFPELPGFPAASVVGHAGVIRSLRAGDKNVLCIMGRVHLYEGHPISVVVHPVRSAIAAGCKIVLLTNACGGLQEDMYPGEPVLIWDHINFTGHSPLTGPTPPAPYDVRFVDLSEAYSRRLRDIARAIDPSLREGVYAGFQGPQYETPAEIHMMRVCGADLVGMSTVNETIAARHMGAEVLGLSLVTNLAAGMTENKLDHTEVLEAGRAAAQRMGGFMRQFIDAVELDA